MMGRSIASAMVCLIFLLLPIALNANDKTLFSAEGYRIARYRAALPETPPVGERVDTKQLVTLIRTKNPLMLDVQAITIRPESEEFGIAWLPSKQRWHIPGSRWLPNVGYGQLTQRMMAYFESNLARLTDGNKERPLVFYCVVDCWMSWNAVKRADDFGYHNLYWYPEGSDGWDEAGLELVPGHPIPLPNMTGLEDCQTGSETAFFDCLDDDLTIATNKLHVESALKGLMLFFETEDCPFCRRMRKGVLRDLDLIRHFRKDFLSFSLDLDNESPLIAPDGSKTTMMAYSREFHRVVRTPTMIFLGRDGEELHRHSGIIVDQRVLRALADYVAGAHYEQIGFRDFVDKR